MVEERKGLQVKQWYRNGHSRPNPESRCKRAPSPMTHQNRSESSLVTERLFLQGEGDLRISLGGGPGPPQDRGDYRQEDEHRGEQTDEVDASHEVSCEGSPRQRISPQTCRRGRRRGPRGPSGRRRRSCSRCFPRFIRVVLIPAAMPLSSGATELITEDLLGGAKIPMPEPTKTSGKASCQNVTAGAVG